MKKIVFFITCIIRMWCILFCVVSLGYFVNNFITNEKLLVVLELKYFLYLWFEGVVFVVVIYLLCETFMATLKYLTNKDDKCQ